MFKGGHFFLLEDKTVFTEVLTGVGLRRLAASATGPTSAESRV